MPHNLTHQDIQDLKAALKQIEDVKEQIKLAEMANIDMTQEKKEIATLEQKIRAIVQVYEPSIKSSKKG